MSSRKIATSKNVLAKQRVPKQTKGGTLTPKIPQKVIVNNTYRSTLPPKSEQAQYDPKTNTILFSHNINAGDLFFIRNEHGIEKRYAATKYFANKPYHQNEVHAYPVFKPFRFMKTNQRFLDTVKLQNIVGFKTNSLNNDAVKSNDQINYNADNKHIESIHNTEIAFNQPISKNDTLQLLGGLYVQPINNIALGLHKTIMVKNINNIRLPPYKVDIRTIMRYMKKKI
jgi:hypothetical protein